MSRSVLDKHARVKTKKVRPQSLPWIDGDYRRERTKRRKQEKAWKKQKTDEMRARYINQKKLCISLHEKKRRNRRKRKGEGVRQEQRNPL